MNADISWMIMQANAEVVAARERLQTYQALLDNLVTGKTSADDTLIALLNYMCAATAASIEPSQAMVERFKRMVGK
jgi:hypothetical protein